MDAKMKIVGASNHTQGERQKNDYYATDPQAFKDFLWAFQERDGEQLHHKIWEPACGEGNLAKVLMERNHLVLGTDLIDRGFGSIYDFLNSSDPMKWEGDIITNPPYKGNQDIGFVRRSLDIVSKGKLVLNFSIRDIFASRIREIQTSGEDFNVYSNGLRGRFVTLGLSYGFGKGEAMTYTGRRR